MAFGMVSDFYFQDLKNKRFNKSAEAKVDRFAYGLCGPQGTYIEIGACGPVQRSNTYCLEKYGWHGFGLELNIRHQQSWKDSERKNVVYWENAITFDYLKAVNELDMPNRINFLQVDIEPPENTFLALQRVIDQGLEFDFISFEHDKYCQENDIDDKVTDYLNQNGYKVAVYNVCAQRKRNPGVWSHIETWYVNKDINFDSIDFFEWMKKYNIT